MNIGELFVTLGAKTDSSWAEGLNKLKSMGLVAGKVSKAMGSAAKEAASGMKRSMREISSAANQAARDTERAAARMGNAFRRENARLMANRGRGASAGNGALGALQDALSGGADRGVTPNRSRPKVGWAAFLAGAPSSTSDDAHNMAMAPGGGRLRKFQPGTGSGMFGEGDPFAPPGKTPPPGKPTKGGGHGGGRRGFNRFGPLGDVSAFRRVILGAGIYQGAQEFGQMADVYMNLQNRLGGITKSQGEANAVFERLFGIANKTRSSLESTGEAYVRIRSATDGMKLSGEQQFKLIERINMAMATSGATASEARSGMLQLTQALAKGKLDGDEFRSLAENMPNVLKILQKSLGVTEGRLRAMSRNGELTREKIVKAFLGAGGIEEAFGKTNATFGQTFEVFKNQLIKAFGELARDKELVAAFAFALEYLAKGIIGLVKILGDVFIALQDFVQGLKDGEVWAYALAAVIGATLIPSVIRLLAYLYKLPIAFAAAALEGRIFGSLGAAGAAGSAAGAGAAGAAGSAAGGKLAGLKNGAMTLSNLLPPVLMAYAANEATGGSMNLDKAFGHFMKEGQVNPLTGNPVSIGPTTVNIYATDAKDAKAQFDQETMDRAMRQAAAAFNRKGS